MQSGAWRPITLVSAPAGFGKSTLVGELVRQADRPTAWLSLDADDSDPSRFLSYLAAAIRGISPEVDEGSPDDLYSSSSSSPDALLSGLINQIAALPDELTLVLDDYHVISNMEVHNLVDFLLNNVPPQMHIVIISRADPPLPLSRLRAQGRMTEIRVADLRFSRDEARQFLQDMMGIDLPEDQIDVLEERTEGWIAGLQMAALSMKGAEDVSGFVAAFAGDDRHILDFLGDEVLEHQPERVQNFLVRTSVLDRLTGDLCDAVTGDSGGSAMLTNLERANLFVVPLDDKREWYRYHHLFADMLKAKLADERPDWERIAHQRASDWYEVNGTIDDAAAHAIEAEDFERAADLLEVKAQSIILGSERDYSIGELRAISASLRPLPDPLVRTRPHLGILYVWWLVYSGQDDAAYTRLLDAELALSSPEVSDRTTVASVGGRFVSNEDRTNTALGHIAYIRMSMARPKGEFESVFDLARKARSLLPEPSNLSLSIYEIQGQAHWMRGDVAGASQSFTEQLGIIHNSDRDLTPISVSTDLGRVRIVQGRLKDASKILQKTLEEVTKRGLQNSLTVSDPLLASSEIFREWNQLGKAEECMKQATKISEREREWANLNHYFLILARLRRSQGDLDAAIEAIEQAKRFPTGQGLSPNINPPDAYNVRLLIANGELDEAMRWTKETRVSVSDAPDYLREFEHITLAKVQIAQHIANPTGNSLEDVLGLLDRLAEAAVSDGRNGNLIEILVVQALAQQASGNIDKAMAPIKRALTMAEPEGYVRVFIDEGEPMRAILEAAVAQRIAVSYAESLLAAFDTGTATPDSSLTPEDTPALAEPLSARESEILQLIVAGKTNQEIADQLFIALDTVKRHVTHIYSKLNVDRRPQAIARAQELGLT